MTRREKKKTRNVRGISCAKAYRSLFISLRETRGVQANRRVKLCLERSEIRSSFGKAANGFIFLSLVFNISVNVVCVSIYVCVCMCVRSVSPLRPLIKEKKEGTLLSFALCSTRFLQKEGKMSRTLEASWYSVRTCTIIFEYLCCDKEQRRHTEITIFNKDIFSSKVLVEDYSTIRYR